MLVLECHVMKVEIKGQLGEVSPLSMLLWVLRTELRSPDLYSKYLHPEPSGQLSVLSFLNKSIYVYVCVCLMFTCELIRHLHLCLRRPEINLGCHLP